MKIYLVGGAVRDKLLNKPVKDRDWVVVGSTTEEMLSLNFISVGKDFPVFLHPLTKEEYALARTEKKISKGYTGFSFNTSIKVSLEDDLKRRDLTINAIALDKNEQLIDPYNGLQDIKLKVLRHVSDAFVEDPVRVLRVARFAAQFPKFSIARETLDLMTKIKQSKELDFLVGERVFQELLKSLNAEKPERFFTTLNKIKALQLVTKIWETPPNCNKINKNFSAKQKFWACCFNVKTRDLKNGIKYLKVPKQWQSPAIWVTEKKWQNISDSKDLLDLALHYDIWRRNNRFNEFKQVGIANNNSDHIFQMLDKLYQATTDINAKDLIREGLDGKKIGEFIYKQRLKAATLLFKKQ